MLTRPVTRSEENLTRSPLGDACYCAIAWARSEEKTAGRGEGIHDFDRGAVIMCRRFSTPGPLIPIQYRENTMLSPQRVILLACIVLIGSQGCGGKHEAMREDLKLMGLMFTEYEIEKQKRPTSWDELITHAKEKNNERAAESIQRVRDADYQVAWDVQPGEQRATDTVLAKPPGEGPVLMLDGRVPEL